MALINENDEASARDSLGGLTKVVTNLLALRGVSGPSLSNTLYMQYGTTFQDGLGGLFIWNPTDVSADNGSTIIKPYSNAVGRWNLLLAQGQAPSGLVAGLGQGVRRTTGGATVAAGDRGYVVANAAGGTVTLPLVATVGNGFIVAISNIDNTGATGVSLTLVTTGGQLIDIPFDGVGGVVGINSLTLRGLESLILVASGTEWIVVGGSGRPVQARAQVTNVIALADAASIIPNAANGNIFDVTITADRSMQNFINPSNGQKILFRITQGVGGSHNIAWGGAYDFGASGAPTLSTAAGKTDLIGGVYNAATSTWQMVPASLGFN